MTAPPVDLSLALCLLSLSLSSTEQCSPIKLNPNPISSLGFLFFPLATTEPTAELLAGFLHGCSTPPKFQPSSAPSPPPLAPRPALVELPAFPSRNCSDPMPLLAGGARGPPHCRQPSSTTSSANLSTGIAPLPLPGAFARLACPCSPAPRWERQHAVAAAAPPRRRPCSTPTHRAHHLPNNTPCAIGHAEPPHPRREPHRRWECTGTDWPAAVESWQGHICEYFSCSRDPCARN
jgi:hypothetical protein